MYKIIVFAVLVAAASAAPGYLNGGLGLGGLGGYGGYGGYGLAQGVAVAHAPIAVAHAPIAVAHAPVATSYANSNLISRTIGVQAIAAPAPVIVKSVASPVAIASPYGLGHGGLALGGLGYGGHY